MKNSQSARAVRGTTAFVLAALLLLAGPAATADEPGKTGQSGDEKAKKDERAESGAGEKPVSPFLQATGNRGRATETKVYDNEDLAKLFGGSGEAAPAAAAAPPTAPVSRGGPSAETGPTALDRLLEGEKLRKEHRAKVTEAEQKIVEAEKRVADLEKRALSTRNPYLPRPAPPEDDDAKAAWESADGKSRVAMADQQLEAAREALARAKEELTALRAATP